MTSTAPTSQHDRPNAVDGQFARRLHGIFQSIHITLSEDVRDNVTVPVTNQGYQPTTVDLEQLRRAFEDLANDARSGLALIAEEIREQQHEGPTYTCTYRECSDRGMWFPSAAYAARWMDQHAALTPHPAEFPITFRIDYPGGGTSVSYRDPIATTADRPA